MIFVWIKGQKEPLPIKQVWKLVSSQKLGNQVEIIKPAANFHENVDFLLIELTLPGNHGGGKAEVRF